MDISGRPHEGWMTIIPVTVFFLIVIVVLGGPVGFVNTLSYWATDLVNYIAGWVKNF